MGGIWVEGGWKAESDKGEWVDANVVALAQSSANKQSNTAQEDMHRMIKILK